MTEREKLIETMARAMCVNEDQDPDHVFVPVTGKPESVVMWTHWKADAEAALTALIDKLTNQEPRND